MLLYTYTVLLAYIPSPILIPYPSSLILTQRMALTNFSLTPIIDLTIVEILQHPQLHRKKNPTQADAQVPLKPRVIRKQKSMN